MIIVDLGCADRDEWHSLEALADKYKPEIIYGFDPSPTLNIRRRRINGTPVKLERKAAWITNGTIQFNDDYIRGGPGPIGVATKAGTDINNNSLGRIGTIGTGPRKARCFDFAQWLTEHGPAVVKMDIEGAEYKLLAHLIKTKTAHLITELIIEWHDHPDPKLTRKLKCPIKDWWM